MIPLSTVQVAACVFLFSSFVDNDCGTLFPKTPCEEIESLDGSGLSVCQYFFRSIVFAKNRLHVSIRLQL